MRSADEHLHGSAASGTWVVQLLVLGLLQVGCSHPLGGYGDRSVDLRGDTGDAAAHVATIANANWHWQTPLGRPWYALTVTADEDLAELRRLVSRRDRTARAALEARDRIYEHIREIAPKPDVKQVDIVEITGWTREHIRSIVKKGDA